MSYPETSQAPAIDEASFVGQWQINIHTRPTAPHPGVHIETQGGTYRLRSDDGGIDEELTLDPRSFNLVNERMAVSLWRDGSRIFAIQQGEAVWGASQVEGRPDPQRPSPGPERPDWRFGREWKVIYKTGDVEHPGPNTKIVGAPTGPRPGFSRSRTAPRRTACAISRSSRAWTTASSKP